MGDAIVIVGEARWYRASSGTAFTPAEERALDASGAVVIVLDGPLSWDVIAAMGYAIYARRLPAIVVGDDHTVPLFGWLRHKATAVVPDVVTAQAVLGGAPFATARFVPAAAAPMPPLRDDPRPCAYLGGRIDGLSYAEATRRRNRVRQALDRRGIGVLDPLRGRAPSRGSRAVHDFAAPTPTIEAIVERDEEDIRRSAVHLVLSGDIPSWGTGLEMAMSAHLLAKPLVVVGTTLAGSPWLTRIATRVVPTLAAAAAAAAAVVAAEGGRVTP